MKDKSPIRNPTYRRLLAAQVIALAGTGLSTIALSLLAFDLAGGDAGLVLGTALAIKMVAYVGIAPIISGYSHRLPRKALLIAMDLGRAAAIGCMPFVTDIWQIYVIIFVLNAFSAGFTPTFQATIPDILPDETQYSRALSYSRLAYDLENLISPVLAALTLAVLTFDSLFALNAIAFVFSAILVLSTSLPKAMIVERKKGIWHNTTFGINMYVKTPRLRGLLALSMAVAAAGSMVIVNSVVYVRDFLEGSELDLTIALAASGTGSMIVALFLPRLLDRLPDRPVMLFGGCILTLGLCLGLTEPDLSGLLPVWFLLGCGLSMTQTPMGRLLARSATQGDRPAIYAAQFALSHACWLVAYPLAGWTGGYFGLEATFGLLAAVTALSTLLATVLWPANDTEVLEHTHAAEHHQHPHVHDEHHQHDHEGWEGPEPHVHAHAHSEIKHRHRYVIDLHHQSWPR